MDTLARSRNRFAKADEHELAEMKGAIDEVGSTHPLLTFAYEDDAEGEEPSPLDATILDGLVHP